MVPHSPQLLASWATQPLEQQSSPREVPEAGVQAGPSAHLHSPATQESPPSSAQTTPQPPQLFGSSSVEMQLPPQQVVPSPQAAPVEPHTHSPPEQISSPGQTLPTSPQLFLSVERLTHWKVPPELMTQTSVVGHWSKLPHMHFGVPLMPSGVEQALARSASQGMPQLGQFSKDESERPSVPVVTLRLTQVVPQQRWDELQVGLHMPVGPLSKPGPPSPPATHMLDMHTPEEQTMPQPPQLFGSLPMGRHEDAPSSPVQHAWKGPHSGSHAPPPPSRSRSPAQAARVRASSSAASGLTTEKRQALDIPTPNRPARRGTS